MLIIALCRSEGCLVVCSDSPHFTVQRVGLESGSGTSALGISYDKPVERFAGMRKSIVQRL